MQERFLDCLEESDIPIPDLELFNQAVIGSIDDVRSFAPLFSQMAYLTMKNTQDLVIGDYTQSGQFSREERRKLVKAIFELVKKRGYKCETKYTAVSVADRYLASVLRSKQKLPDFWELTAGSLLIAAKLEQPTQPNFRLMINFLQKQEQVSVSRESLIDLEFSILTKL
jgi:hypothetical protein